MSDIIGSSTVPNTKKISSVTSPRTYLYTFEICLTAKPREHWIASENSHRLQVSQDKASLSKPASLDIFNYCTVPVRVPAYGNHSDEKKCYHAPQGSQDGVSQQALQDTSLFNYCTVPMRLAGHGKNDDLSIVQST